MLAIAFSAMSCQMQALVVPSADATEVKHAAALSQVPAKFMQAEQRFSRFLPDSELMTLNRERTLQVSEPSWQMMLHSLASARLTQGLVTPTVLPTLLERGYRTSFNPADTAKPVESRFNPPRGQASLAQWQTIHTEPNTRQISLPDAALLDFSGFAKGLTAWQVANDLGNGGAHVLIDAGGDIVTFADSQARLDANEAVFWEVELPSASDITLPLDAVEPVDAKAKARLDGWHMITNRATLGLPQQSMMLATSGIDYRHWFAAGNLNTHLVNLATDQPSAVVCASVLIDEAYVEHAAPLHPAVQQFMATSNACNLAQTLSKVCCLLGLTAGLAWLNRHQLDTVGLSVIVATPQGFEQWVNPAMQPYLLGDKLC